MCDREQGIVRKAVRIRRVVARIIATVGRYRPIAGQLVPGWRCDGCPVRSPPAEDHALSCLQDCVTVSAGNNTDSLLLILVGWQVQTVALLPIAPDGGDGFSAVGRTGFRQHQRLRHDHIVVHCPLGGYVTLYPCRVRSR